MKTTPILLAIGLLLSGCAGSGEGGKITPQDTATFVGAVREGVGIYNQLQNPYAIPVAPVSPIQP